jgi:CheY-like chemotaxis protein
MGERSEIMNPLGVILVVEDERIVAKDLQQRLGRLGFFVPDIASSGDEAIRKAESLRPNLVVMDINLRGTIDGIEAARQIRERFKIPVLFLSAYGDDDTLDRTKRLEPVGYLGKPFEDHELYSVLNRFFSRGSAKGK